MRIAEKWRDGRERERENLLREPTITYDREGEKEWRRNGEGMERGWGGMRVSEVERERKGNEERRKQEEYH